MSTLYVDIHTKSWFGMLGPPILSNTHITHSPVTPSPHTTHQWPNIHIHPMCEHLQPGFLYVCRHHVARHLRLLHNLRKYILKKHDQHLQIHVCWVTAGLCEIRGSLGSELCEYPMIYEVSTPQNNILRWCGGWRLLYSYWGNTLKRYPNIFKYVYVGGMIGYRRIV